jgi:hypothetical protein
MPPPFLFFFAISVSSPALIPFLSEPSSHPWPPHNHTCFKRPS